MKNTAAGTSIQLRSIAHARSGDKGNTVNIGLIAIEPRYYELLTRYVTAGAVKTHFAGICRGDVKRYELPKIQALNFVLYDALDGGGTVSLRTDAQGKTLGAALLRLEIILSAEDLKIFPNKSSD